MCTLGPEWVCTAWTIIKMIAFVLASPAAAFIGWKAGAHVKVDGK